MSGRLFVVRRGTTPVPNRTVHDQTLSYTALGVLTVLLSRPDGAPSSYRALEGRGLGKDAMLKALRELDEAGYRHQFRTSGDRGRLRTDTIVSEVPITRAEAERELRGDPLTGLPEPVNNPSHRAAESRARSDLGKDTVSAGGTVRGLPEPGRPDPGQPPHNYYVVPSASHYVRDTGVSKVDSNVVELSTACPHGEPRGPGRCALCRRGIGTAHVPTPLDVRARAAGEHLGSAQ